MEIRARVGRDGDRNCGRGGTFRLWQQKHEGKKGEQRSEPVEERPSSAINLGLDSKEFSQRTVTSARPLTRRSSSRLGWFALAPRSSSLCFRSVSIRFRNPLEFVRSLVYAHTLHRTSIPFQRTYVRAAKPRQQFISLLIYLCIYLFVSYTGSEIPLEYKESCVKRTPME